MLAGCDRPLEDGVYAFSAERVEFQTCEDAPAPPERFQGELETFGNELQIAFFVPALGFATGERTLVGRYFHGRHEEREFIADSSFRTFLPVGGLDCPAFTQLGLRALTDGELAFAGTLRATYEMDLRAPQDCPRACAWSVRFRAHRIGDIMNELPRSEP